jgi:hypothetical protein
MKKKTKKQGVAPAVVDALSETHNAIANARVVSPDCEDGREILSAFKLDVGNDPDKMMGLLDGSYRSSQFWGEKPSITAPIDRDLYLREGDANTDHLIGKYEFGRETNLIVGYSRPKIAHKSPVYDKPADKKPAPAGAGKIVVNIPKGGRLRLMPIP